VCVCVSVFVCVCVYSRWYDVLVCVCECVDMHASFKTLCVLSSDVLMAIWCVVCECL